MAVNRTSKWPVVLIGLFLANAAFADSWRLATTEQYVSADGDWRLTVEPRPLTSHADYFKDAADGKNTPGRPPENAQPSAMGLMERRVGKHWQQVWQRPLRNDVAPVNAIALPGGAAMTLDNWHSMGIGRDTVVLYDTQGMVMASYALTDFLPREYVLALPRSVSSIHWRREPTVLPGGRRVSVPMVFPPQDVGKRADEDAQFVPVVFDLEFGRVEPPSGAAWERAQEKARAIRVKQRAREEAEYRQFTQPLKPPPASAKEHEWHRYLREAFYRLDPPSEDEYPDTEVLQAPTTSNYAKSVEALGESLRQKDREGPLLIASPSQDALLGRIEAEAKRVPAGALSQARVYLVMDDAHFARAQAALAPSGALLMQVDPAVPIAQSPERLEQWKQFKEERDAVDD